LKQRENEYYFFLRTTDDIKGTHSSVHFLGGIPSINASAPLPNVKNGGGGKS